VRAGSARAAFALTLSVALSAACTGAGTADPASPPLDSSDSAAPTLAPDPVQVRVTLDPDRATSATIGPAGGAVSATSADGVTFALEVPAHALAGDRTITLTPIRSIASYPFAAGPAAGVHMEPSGVRFFAPATLRIEGAPPIGAAELIGFGYSGDGADFHLTPVAATASGYALRISHFSGAGVGAATDAEFAAQQDHAPVDYQSAMDQELVALLTRERQCVVIGMCEGESEGGGGVETTLTEEEEARTEDLVEGWEEVLKRTAEEGRTRCAAYEQAMRMLAGAERQLAFFEAQLDPALLAAVADPLEDGARNCLVEAYEKCRTAHDVGQFVAMYELVREAEFVDMSGGLSALAAELGSKCATFELEYRAEVNKRPYFPHYHYTVNATVGLESSMSSTGNVTLTGSASLEITDWYDWADDPCWPTTVTTPTSKAPFVVTESEWKWSTATDGSRAIAELALTVEPGAVAQTASGTCGGEVDEAIDAGSFYDLAFVDLHKSAEGAGTPAKVTFASGDILGGELYARTSYEKSTVWGDSTVDGTFEFSLWHRPPPLHENER
jgi:hypothetical protein